MLLKAPLGLHWHGEPKSPVARANAVAILEMFGGGPVGLEALAAAISEEKDTIEDVIEPYLIQQGYLMRTPRGRVATPKCYQHFGLDPGESQPQLKLS